MASRSYPTSPEFWKLVALEKKLMELPVETTTFSIRTLKEMGIDTEPRLDIDDPDATDSSPVFFKPFPDIPAWRSAINDLIDDEGDDWDHCPDEKEHFDRLSCALHVIHSLTYLTQYGMLMDKLYPNDAPKWSIISADQGVHLPEYSASDIHLRKHGERPIEPLPQWSCPSVMVVKKTREVNHILCPIADNISHKLNPDHALRSEITAGVSMIRRRITVTHDTYSPIPVLLLSFYHNETVRITQMCWNGERNPITIRQSRLINIVSNSFKREEIYLLLRWMCCIPLREPKVRRKQSTTGEPGRPATPLRTGTGSNSSAASKSKPASTPVVTHPAVANAPTPTGTPTQKTSGAVSSNNSPARSEAPTSARRTTNKDTSASPPRPTTNLPLRPTTPPTASAPSKKAAGNTTARTTPGGNGAAHLPGHHATSLGDNSPPRAKSAPSAAKQIAGLPVRGGSTSGNGGTSSNAAVSHAKHAKH